MPEALAISGLKEGLKLSGCEDHSRLLMAAVQKIKLVGKKKIKTVYGEYLNFSLNFNSKEAHKARRCDNYVFPI